MNHLDFLDTSERLIATHAPAEADIRTVVSRSYYAVYHHVLSWWRDNESFPDYRDRGHAKIQMAFFNAGMPDARDFSTILRTLNRNRREADYELAIYFDLEDGQSILNLARNAIAVFDRLDKTALSEGILNYLQRTNQI